MACRGNGGASDPEDRREPHLTRDSRRIGGKLAGLERKITGKNDCIDPMPASTLHIASEAYI